MSDRAPIRIRCEGSGHAGVSVLASMCAMCGRFFTPRPDGKMPDHDRDDVIAMINRGDFG